MNDERVQLDALWGEISCVWSLFRFRVGIEKVVCVLALFSVLRRRSDKRVWFMDVHVTSVLTILLCAFTAWHRLNVELANYQGGW